MGLGVSALAMQEIIRYGFVELGLRKVYWCVAKNNGRAIRFYDKNGFDRVGVENICKYVDENYSASEIETYLWYLVEQ